MQSRMLLLGAVTLLALALGRPAAAQVHDDGAHAAHMQPGPGRMAAEAGQAAYGAIAEVVRILDADAATDWSRVDLERLRRHLIDMDLVTLQAAAGHTPVQGGVRMVVTGEGRTREAIVRMTGAHASELEALGMKVEREQHSDGVVLTVTAQDPGDVRAVSRIRGLGFAGLMALGDHHGPHHLAMARGDGHAGHGEGGGAE